MKYLKVCIEVYEMFSENWFIKFKKDLKCLYKIYRKVTI